MDKISEILQNFDMEQSSKPLSPKEWQQELCDAYNKTEGDLNKDGYNCDICRNKGYISEPREYAGTWTEVFVPCRCRAMRALIRKLNKSGLKNAVEKHSFKSFETTEPWQKKLLEAAKAYAADPKGWFYIAGQSGCGKTHLCTAIAISLIRKGWGAKYMVWRSEVRDIKAAVTEYEVYAAMMNELKNAKLLYIDDLFKTGNGQDGRPQRPTAADVNVALEILGYRYDNELPTIISTECALDELIEIDEALAGRIAQMAGHNCYNIAKDRKKNYRLKNVVEL